MTQDKETLREAVARSMKPSLFEGGADSERGPTIVHERNIARSMADAAIATMFERLRTPSEGMIEAGERAWMNRDLSDPDSNPIRDCFCAMLTAFQQENSDER